MVGDRFPHLMSAYLTMAIDRQDSPYRRGNRYDRLPIPMVEDHCIPVDAGAVQLVIKPEGGAHRDYDGLACASSGKQLNS